MKQGRTTLLWTALILVLIGGLHTAWRHFVHQVPLLPGSQQTYWDLEARVEMEAEGVPVKVRLAIPQSQPGFLMRSEHTASPGFGVSFLEGEQRYAEWSIRSATDTQWLYYRAQFQHDPKRHVPAVDNLPDLSVSNWSLPLKAAAAQVLRRAWQESADPFSLAKALAERISNENNQNARLLVSQMTAAEVMVNLLNDAKIPARVLYGLKLEDGRRRQALQQLVQVFDGQNWQLFDVNSALSLDITAKNYLLWQQQAGPILEVEGAHESKVTFSMLTTHEPASSSVNALAIKDALLSLSIHSLPISEQALFKTLLLLPLGALVVVALRVFVGLKTSGTFMPLLIALAFLEMSLSAGLITFLLLVSVGLVLRQLLAHLNLLLVARVAAVIVCVIGMIALFAVISFHTGISTGMKVTLFPMIILAWTIERMSILWEEEGPLEVVKQGGGSLITAIFAFLLMDIYEVRYWMFNFLGLQLVVLALILIVGSYTGYRLLELWRFSPLAGDKHLKE
ncbi:MAG: inactive transglutaminase family protein [Pseudomonadaceae bacterium]|nr:inactive transglutaminase family protein [Pseudomonadaceae bacterium]